MNRSCNGCTLCCRLVPVEELAKPANEKCKHQFAMGCLIYAKRPLSCQKWNCRWLADDRTIDLARPDRSHYVIDTMFDFIVASDNETGEKQEMIVLQVWCDPDYPDAHKDPALRDYIDKLKMPALIRYSNNSAIVLVPPSVTAENEWLEHKTDFNPNLVHSLEEKAAMLKKLGAS